MANNEQLTKPQELLSNYYILPLLGVGRPSYGPQENYLCTQLTQHNQIVVGVLDRTLVAWQALQEHPAYVTDFQDPEDGTHRILYQADVWQPDIAKFKEGKYSQFSVEAKKRIRQFAGDYDIYGNHVLYSKLDNTPHMKLVMCALDRHERGRAYWETTLGVKLDPEAEVVSIPQPDCFTYL